MSETQCVSSFTTWSIFGLFPFLLIMNEVDNNTHIQVLFHHNFSFLIGKYLGLELMNFICAVLSRFSHVQLFATLWTAAHRLLCLWDSPGKNATMSCHAPLQGIFLTQGLNLHLLGLLHW